MLRIARRNANYINSNCVVLAQYIFFVCWVVLKKHQIGRTYRLSRLFSYPVHQIARSARIGLNHIKLWYHIESIVEIRSWQKQCKGKQPPRTPTRVGRGNSTRVDDGRKCGTLLPMKTKSRVPSWGGGRGRRRACLVTPNLSLRLGRETEKVEVQMQ